MNGRSALTRAGRTFGPLGSALVFGPRQTGDVAGQSPLPRAQCRNAERRTLNAERQTLRPVITLK